MNCVISVYLAYGMAIYVLASIYYLVMTRNIGTPFKDSLTEKQRKIQRESGKQRKTIFYQGIAASIVLMVLTRPFNKCFKGRLP
jgi:hypothetical protein